MTPLDRLRALHAAATPGEWSAREDIDNDCEGFKRLYRGYGFRCTSVADGLRSCDRDSIAATHNALPSLLACVDALRSLYPDHPALAPLVKEEP